jgi:hypothetical protein
MHTHIYGMQHAEHFQPPGYYKVRRDFSNQHVPPSGISFRLLSAVRLSGCAQFDGVHAQPNGFYRPSMIESGRNSRNGSVHSGLNHAE